MKFIMSPFQDCYLNIASEEYLVNHIADDIFLLYINAPSIIIGTNQNTYAEINHSFVEKHAIKVVRRRSGGGAVYHDTGNLNFCFITGQSTQDSQQLFKTFTAPILAALSDLGVTAEFSGRNDLTIDGKKFSGNAQWRTNQRTLVHGTLLFNSELSVLSEALNANEFKFVGKAVKSVRSRVTNIKPHLANDATMQQLIDAINKRVTQSFSSFENYQYNAEDIAGIEQLATDKYGTAAWNFGESPKFNYTQRFKYDKGTVELHAQVKDGKLIDTKIYGDFFGTNPNIKEVEQVLINQPYTPSALLAALETIDLSAYIDGLEPSILVDAYFND